MQQAVPRGPVPELAWAPYAYDHSVREFIERKVIEHGYPKGSTFHPLDPIELMFLLRNGDLNEMEIVMAVEREFGVELIPKFIERLIRERTNFIDFIRWIESARST
ncbi:MAG: hypothetical protein IT207_08745 [Fimbriimonadaceae bacterium]|nr:hypothetical protein [Fimbriimonadaceae bacterium]